MTVYYTLEFYSFWHAGSGLGTRSDYDAIVIKDENGIAYVPGKTIAGLVKDAGQDLLKYANSDYKDISLDKLFGKDNPPSSHGKNRAFEEETTTDGNCSFSNAYPLGYDQILSKELSPYMYFSKMATALDAKHQTKNHSLRKVEMTIPCVLSGSISNVPDDPPGNNNTNTFLENCFKLIKRQGYNRTRGLGRCRFIIVETS